MCVCVCVCVCVCISPHSRVSPPHRAGLPVLYSSFPLALFTHCSVYMSVLLSQFVPPSSSPTVSTSLLSVPALQVGSSITIFLDPICVLICDVCFSLSDLLYMTDSRSIHISTNDSILFLLTYMYSTSYEMPGWMNPKLESKFLGEISITSDMQIIPL